jgi:Zn-dependent protease
MPLPHVVGVETLRDIVDARFPVYDTEFDDRSVAFYVEVPDESRLEEEFEGLRRELRSRGLLPMIQHRGGEHRIYVLERPTREGRSRATNVALFLLTWVTTTMTGALAWFSYASPGADLSNMGFWGYLGAVFAPSHILGGFATFALPLMTILGIHEAGHYIMTKRHGMEASLPYFIPLPPFFRVNIGTLGAFISMREPIPNRKALLDIGVAGPLAGFVVTIPVLLVGMGMMKIDPVTVAQAPGRDLVTIGTPLLYDLMARPFDFSNEQLIHPTAFAGWVGLFVTAINLIPAGQLDGGHMAAALMGDRARYVSYAAVAALAVLGFGIPRTPLPVVGAVELAGFSSWLLFALLIAVLGIRHPPTLDNVTDLDRTRRIVGWATFGIIVLSFTPVPFQV